MANLAQLIETAVRWALKHRGYDHRRTVELPHGLSLVIYVDAGGGYHLRLRRLAPAWPSEQELTTVLRHWPAESRPDPQPPATPASGAGAVSRLPWLDPKAGLEYNCVSMAWTPGKARMKGEG